MRFTLLAVGGLLLAGCGTLESAADDPVPTMSVRATPDAAEPTETASGFEISAEATAEATDEQTDAPEETGIAEPSDAASAEPTRSAKPSKSVAADAPVDLATAPANYRQAVAYVEEVRSRGSKERAVQFRTGEDIYCVLQSDWFDPACELPQGAGIADQKACADAMGDRVGRVSIAKSGPVAVCNTDTIRESMPDLVGQPTLVAGGGIDCAVTGIGVTCVHTARKVGFVLGLDAYATFG